MLSLHTVLKISFELIFNMFADKISHHHYGVYLIVKSALICWQDSLSSDLL